MSSELSLVLSSAWMIVSYVRKTVGELEVEAGVALRCCVVCGLALLSFGSSSGLAAAKVAARRALAAEMMPAIAEWFTEPSFSSVLVASVCGGSCACGGCVLRIMSEAPGGTGTGATMGVAMLRDPNVSGGVMPGRRAQRIC